MGILTTEDISSILLFICSNYGRFITGLTINVNE